MFAPRSPRPRLILGVVALAALTAACTRPSTNVGSKPGSSASAASDPKPQAVPAPIVKRLGAGAGSTAVSARQGSGVLLADLDGRRVAYIADEDESLVRVIDVDDERELSSFNPGGAPSALAMLPDGRLIAAVRDAGQIVILKGGGTTKSPLAIDARVDVAAEPIGLALSSDDATLVATSGWGRTVTVIDTKTFTKKAEHRVSREPRSVVISSDDKRAFVSHAVGQTLDMIALVDVPVPEEAKAGGKNAKNGTKKPAVPPGPVSKITLGGSEEVAGRGMMISTQDRLACQGFALAKTETGRVLAPHVLVFPGEPEPSSGYGGGSGREAEVFHVPIIDEDNGKLIPESKQLRAGVEGNAPRCALPRAAAMGKAGLFVTCLGDNTVELLDPDVVNPHDTRLKKWSVPAGPTAIALDEANDRALVWSQFAHSLTKIAIGAEGDGKPRAFALSSITLMRSKEDPKVERGRILFHSTTEPRISGDGRACASCHPDGRDDTLVWSSPKGPRQTPILAGRLQGAAPFGWNGDAPDVDKHLVQTVKRLGGSGLEGEDKAALMAYLEAMRPPPGKPARPPQDAIDRGAVVFRSAETACATCHGVNGDLPDGSQHDVKSRNATDVQAKFDTPSLKLVGGSAPYFHDGRYPDLKTLLVKSDGKMGRTKHLSPGELSDLESYLESL